MKKKIIIVFVLLLAGSTVLSQPFVDIVNLKYSRFPKTDFKNNKNFQTSTNQYYGEFFIPLQLKSKNFILFGGSYDRLDFNLYNNKTHINGDSDRLYQLSFQGGLIKNLGKSRWNVTILAIPKISECYSGLSIRNDYFQMGGAVLFSYKKRNSLKLKFGLFYNREFFGNYFMPLAGIDWKINDHMYLFGVLPGSMNYEYRICKGFYTGLAYKSNTASYRLYAYRYIREGDKFWGHNMIRNYYQFYVTKQLMLFGEIGYTGFRIFEEYNIQNMPDVSRFVFQKTKDHIYFDAGIAFRVRLDNDYND
ncbi:MAG: DUF6268 family outer membrane beta-barrel protein [Bacteroidota bacterium]